MKNQETATYAYDPILKRWTVKLFEEEKLVFIDRFSNYTEAVRAVQRVHEKSATKMSKTID